jgi:hypothetical protein
VSPFISPFLLGYMIPTTNFRDVYWVGCVAPFCDFCADPNQN